MSVENRVLYDFGPFRLEPDEHLLLREGKPTPLTPKAFDLLVLLVRNQGRLVTKDQIMQAIWSGSFVEEANITVLISSLRKVLGENEAGDPYIKTVPKKGYRFTATVKVAGCAEAEPITPSPLSHKFVNGSLQTVERDKSAQAAGCGTKQTKNSADLAAAGESVVRESLESDAATTARSDWPGPFVRNRPILAMVLIGVGTLAAAGYLLFRNMPPPRTLAVLPLQNLRHDPDSEFLSFSLADAVISKLGVLSSLTVRPSSAIQKYKDQDVDIRQVAQDLHVNTLLTGTFIRDGDRLRVTYQLIDVPGVSILCKDVIDLKYDELLIVHDSVSQQIIKGLQLNLRPSETESIKPDETVRPLAYEYFLRGIDLMASHNFPLAVKMLEKSTEIDPTYPLTWAYLGQSYTSDATFTLTGRQSYARAQAAYERALALQPRQLEAQMFLANLLIDTGKVEQAVPLLRDAISRKDNNAAIHWELGYAYRFAGMLKQSLAECERARQIDPGAKSNGSVLNTYLYLGQYDDFIRSLPDVNESPFFRFYRGFARYHQRDLPNAAADFTRAYAEGRTLYTGIGKAFAESIASNRPSGLQILQDLEAKIQQRGVGDPEASYKIAQAYAALGDKASALRDLRFSIESGFFCYPYFLRDPLLDTLRDSAVFPDLMRSAQQRYQAFQKRFF